MPHLPESEGLLARARAVLPGGVNSPVRAYGAVGGTPPFLRRGEGAYVEDEDGNRYVDYVASWGPMLLGHADPDVVQAVIGAARQSTSFGAPTRLEVQIGELICELMPSIERVRMVNSGTEAAMSAARLARGYTGRDRVIKFSGHYHGHADLFLIAAGSGATTLGQPNSPGVTAGTARDTLLARFNDLESVQALFQAHEDEIACIIVEPIAGNMGCVPPEEGFLEGLRSLCDRHRALLVFDEVMTGFRVERGGAQARYGVRPDLTVLGKVIGGGMPVGAYGGRSDVMDMVSPAGPVYQAGTLSGNPVAMAAGYAALKKIATDDALYERLEAYGEEWDERLQGVLREMGIDLYRTRVGSMGCLFFTPMRVVDYESALSCDTAAFARYFHRMLDEGIYLAPSQFEAYFYSSRHGDTELERTVRAQKEALAWAFDHQPTSS